MHLLSRAKLFWRISPTTLVKMYSSANKSNEIVKKFSFGSNRGQKNFKSMNSIKIISYFTAHYNSFKDWTNPNNPFLLEFQERFHTFSDKEIIDVCDHIKNHQKFLFGSVSEEFAKSLIERLKNVEKSENKFKLLSTSSLIDIFRSHSIQYESIYGDCIKLYTIDEISRMEYNDICDLIGFISNISMHNKLFDIEIDSKSIFEVFEQILYQKMQKNSPSIINLYFIIKGFVLADKGTEDFLRDLESRFFPNLDQITDDILIELVSFYHRRILHNHVYILNDIYRHIYESFIQRFEKMNHYNQSTFIGTYWYKSNYYGMYHDDKLKNKIIDCLGTGLKDLKTHQRSRLVLNFLSYLNHSRSLDANTVQLLYDTIKSDLKIVNPYWIISLGLYFSRSPDTPAEFWYYHKEIYSKILSSTKLLTILYSTQLNLRLQNPEHYKIISEAIEPLLDKITELWRKKRASDIYSSSPTHYHLVVQKVLKEMKIEYIEEYFFEYFIDIALPKYKICYEILGPGHYLFPSRELNGRTYNKKINLERLGWRYYDIGFFKQRSSSKYVKKFILDTIPLDY